LCAEEGFGLGFTKLGIVCTEVRDHKHRGTVKTWKNK